ncbi:WXG100 family type VII secretion target [Arthrobacter sp. L77]|uniref:WXG100 family type VII secretion target n=1 Tax=Arthrobacter sp. L77 TaxID=1496689 RepID=UPI00068D3680|nr:WXG100 family type VII secretion target [Arthrobacter sp. L77]
MAIQIDYAAMENEASALQAAASDFESSLATLLSRITNLTSPSGGFSTEVASGKFGTSYQDFDHQARNLIPALHAFQSDLRNSIDRFKTADGAV